MSIRKFLRSYMLKRHRTGTVTAIKPITQGLKVVTMINADDPQYEACRNAIDSWYHAKGLRGDFLIIDFRKLIDKERLTTSITNTILRKDLDLLGRPSREKLGILDNLQADLLIILPKFEDNFPIEYLAACSNVGCKVGIKGGDSKIYDIEISAGQESSQLELFRAITDWMDKIK